MDGDILQMLRLRNAFGPPENNPPITMAEPPLSYGLPQEPTPASDMWSRIKEIYQPEEAAINKTNELLGQIPERTKPEWWRVLLGGLTAGLTKDINQGRYVAEAPYYRKMEEWKSKFDPYSSVAKEERMRNANERMLAMGTATQERGERALDIREKQGEERIALERSKVELQRWKLNNPDGKIIFHPDGYIHLVNPRTGEDTPTKIEHGKMSEIEKLNLQHENRMAEIGAQQAGATERAGIAADTSLQRTEIGKWTTVNVIDDETGKEKSYRINTATGEMIPITSRIVRPDTATPGGQGQSANQQKVALYLKAQEAANTHPEWQPYIKFGKTNEFKVTKPGMISGPKREVYDAINEFIYGTGASPMRSSGGTQTPKVGDTKTFPNGNKAVWDGRGWRQQP